MSAFFANLTFMNPIILMGLLALPIIYFLLRITPPAPKIIRLPTVRFLEGLKPESTTSDKTPWWILLLRLAIAALVIIAFARPVYTPSDQLPGSGPVHIIIDNDWASAHNWAAQSQMAESLINQAERENRDLYLQPTIKRMGETAGPFTPAQAHSILKELKPNPYEADYKDFEIVENDTAFWLSHGLMTRPKKALLEKLDALAILPDNTDLPLILKPSQERTDALSITVDGPKALPQNMPITLQVLNQHGQILDQKPVKLQPQTFPQNISFELPNIIRNEVARIQIAGDYGAAGVLIFDGANARRSVGIAGPADEARMKPFIEARYYLSRALEPFAEISSGYIDALLEEEPSMLILPDIASMPVETLEALENWVSAGGLLLRFVGPNTAENTNESGNALLPMPLKSSTRATDGNLSWEDTPTLAPFPEDSPFFDIQLHEDIHIRQQILPAAPDNEDVQIWASLDDGTPLITARPQKRGLIVLIHTSASPDWSALALSGVYVEILKRLVNLSGTKQTRQESYASLQPQWVLDGFGRITTPDAVVQPIAVPLAQNLKPSVTHPPGLYGSASNALAFNLGDTLPPIKSVHPETLKTMGYTQDNAQDFMPYILYAAFMLLMLDWLVMMTLAGSLKTLARVSVFVLLVMPSTAFAQDSQYAEGLYLAYVQTGNPAIDATSQKGLQNLATILKRRTSAEPEGVASLNLETDTLVFFPFIYWPLSESATVLSEKALRNVQSYLDHGGTILFDTRGQNTSRVREVTRGLSIPPLQPIDDDHVLKRSFYLLDEFPGRYSGQTFWVEQNNQGGRDGVSSTLIGSHDWASAWAESAQGRSAFTGRSRQQELAYRFGVNLMMYALTGNYKADQVHIPHILERLGQ